MNKKLLAVFLARNVLVTLLVLTFSRSLHAVSIEESPESRQASSLEDSGETTCGPLCIQHIAAYYDLGHTDLIEIVKKVQWPNFASGTSLAKISTALTEMGVHNSIVKLSPDVAITWPYPIILHLREPAPGHFVVIEPSDDTTENVRYWDGFKGYKSCSQNYLAEIRSGYALLTYPEEFHGKHYTFQTLQTTYLPLKMSAYLLVALNLLVYFLVFRPSDYASCTPPIPKQLKEQSQ